MEEAEQEDSFAFELDKNSKEQTKRQFAYIQSCACHRIKRLSNYLDIDPDLLL